MRSLRRSGWAGPLLLVVLAASAPAATVTYSFQDHRVFARANGGVTKVSEVNFSPGAGVVTAIADGNNDDFVASASATQVITTGDAGFIFTGRLAYDVARRDPQAAVFPEGETSVGFEDSLRFAIIEPHDFRFFFGLTTERDSGSRGDEVDYRLATTDGEIIFASPRHAPEGTLAAGEYAFRFSREIGTVGEGAFAGTYRVGLDLTPVGGGPAPIPLPPGVWGGLATMASWTLWRRLGRPQR
jgi:hypothetical protein